MARRWSIARIARAAALLLVLIAVAGLSWFALSERALQWTLARVEAASDGRLRIAAPAGSLLGPASAARIDFTDGPLAVHAERVSIAVDWAGLATGTLRLRSLAVAALRVALPPSDGTPPKQPASLAVPFRFEIGRLAVERIEIAQGDTQTRLSGLAGALAAGGPRHRLRLEHLEVAGARLEGTLSVGAQAPFALEGALHAALESGAGPLQVSARVDGTLSKVGLALEGALAKQAATGSAVLAPFEADWLASALLEADGVDAAAFTPGTPGTDLQLRLRAQGGAADVLTGNAEVTNARAGALSANRVPLVAVQTAFRIDGTVVRLHDLRADLAGAGQLRGEGVIDGLRSRLNVALEGVDLKAVHASLHRTRLSGTLALEADERAQRVTLQVRDAGMTLQARARHENDTLHIEQMAATVRGGVLNGTGEVALSGTQRFKADLKARGFDPASFGEWPRAALNGSVTASGQLKPAPQVEVSVALANSRFGKAALQAQARFEATAGSIRALVADLRVGANRLRATGDFGRAGDAIAFSLDAGNLAQLDARLAGRLRGEGSVSGSPQRPGGRVALLGESLALQKHIGAGRLALKASVSDDADRLLSLELDLAGVRAPQGMFDSVRLEGAGRLTAHELTLRARNAAMDARLALAGGLSAAGVWRGVVREFVNEGATPARLQSAASLEIARGRVLVGAAQVRVLDGEFALESLRWEQGQLASTGRMRAMPAAPLIALAGLRVDRGTDLRLKGGWSIRATPRLNGTLRVARESGDLQLATEPRFAAGLAELSLEARFAEDALDLEARLQATRLGSAHLRANLAPGPTPGIPSMQSRLRGTIEARVPTLSPVHAFIGGGLAIDGRAEATLELGGTLAAPELTGTGRLSGVRIDLPRHALSLHDGQAQLKLDGQSMTVASMSIRGPEGVLRANGTVARDGGEGRLDWRAEGLRVFNRPDRQLVVSGSGSVGLQKARIALRGELRADQGLIEYRRAGAERLGDDVEIVGRGRAAATGDARALPLDLDMTLDVGERFRLHVLGLDATLRGRVQVRNDAAGRILAKGAIETRDGTYRAFGQALVIERGRLGFDGPIDNPTLDVLALRKNQPVEAGVQVTGAVRSPTVRLTSNPSVPDHEKLSWLLLGHGAANAQGADLAMLQAAAGALAGPEGGAPLNVRIARDLGLDEVGIRSQVGGQVVALGKRLSDRVYFEFEQGLTVAATLVRLKFLLTQTLSLRAEASPQGSGVGVGYGRSYD